MQYCNGKTVQVNDVILNVAEGEARVGKVQFLNERSGTLRFTGCAVMVKPEDCALATDAMSAVKALANAPEPPPAREIEPEFSSK